MYDKILNNIILIFFYSISLEDGALKKFLETAKELSPEERGKALENDKGVTEDHQALAQVILFVMSSYLKCVYGVHFICILRHGGVCLLNYFTLIQIRSLLRFFKFSIQQHRM